MWWNNQRDRLLRSLLEWWTKMDAQVQALTANVTQLTTDVAAVLAELQAIQQQLANGIDAADEAAITAADEAAITAANTALAAANAKLAAVIPASPTS